MLHLLRTHLGALAHLARALDWQSKGDRFESDMLHSTYLQKKQNLLSQTFLLIHINFYKLLLAKTRSFSSKHINNKKVIFFYAVKI